MTTIDPAEVDDHGQWTGTCDTCGTDHDGYLPDSIGAHLRCIRTRGEQLGRPDLVEQVDAVQRVLDRERDRVIRDYFRGEAQT